MASRTSMNRRYGTQRTLLILLMGSKCKYCSERRPWLLQFHHIKGTTWNIKKTGRNRRIRLYVKDWANNMLVLACGKCNKKIGRPLDGVPF